MIATHTQQRSSDLSGSLIAGLRRMVSLAARVVFSVLLIMSAGIVAIATAMAGLLLALAAIVFSLAGTRDRLRPYPVPARGASSEGVVLDARRTSRGWRVD